MGATATATKVALGNIRAMSAIAQAAAAEEQNVVQAVNANQVAVADDSDTLAVAAPAIVARGAGRFRVTADVSGDSGAGFDGGTLVIRSSLNGAGQVDQGEQDIAGPPSSEAAGNIDEVVTVGDEGDSIVFSAYVILPSIGGTNTLTIPAGDARITVQELLA